MLHRRAPEFPKNFRWLNVSRPLSLQKDLRGRFVLLDFWTYCCINCIHVLPELKRIEKEFPHLVVIGIHSAKFENENDEENVRAAILRYDIEHPVLLDEGYQVWQMYDSHAWPTFVLIGPEGEILWRSSGEGIYDALTPLLRKWYEAHTPSQADKPLPLRLEKHVRATGLLAFPGKVTVAYRPSHPGPILYFTDSNHNRIVGTTPSGVIQEIIGSGDEGWQDGKYEEAAFFRPQGLAYNPAEDALYVADTENHLIRRIRLSDRRVETLAGTGKQSRRLLREGRGTSIALNSPWDLALSGHTLYIAMAGSHQLWKMNLLDGSLHVVAGSGYENLSDGPCLLAALAQPSGLALGPRGELYVADSETSSIRVVQNGTVHTIVGKGLFDFGYRDGSFDEALLQHPIGLCYHEECLYVADTYNHSIRKIDLRQKKVTTLIGAGKRGYQDGPAQEALLNEPNDLLWVKDSLYIVDTNNHLLRRFDPHTGFVSTLELYPVDKIAVPRARTQSLFTRSVPLPPTSVPLRKPFRIEVNLPFGYVLNTEAPSGISLSEKRYPLGEELPPLEKPTEISLEVYVCKGKASFAQCLFWCYQLILVPESTASSVVSLTLPPLEKEGISSESEVYPYSEEKQNWRSPS
ncbi:MAG: thioredoxin-like domain-containing protein [Bacteroidia bacterium]|nr:thioredoxin-like domain-containing protein [Bacteroidia bacterium]